MDSAFPFSPQPHRKYRNTFLQSIFLEFKFSAIDAKNLYNFKESLQKFVVATFGLDLQMDTETDFWSSGISISRTDRTSEWFLSNGLVAVKIGVKDYLSFVDTILPQAYKMRTFLTDVMKVNCVSEIKIRKINLWQFQNDNSQKIDPLELRKSVLSNDLLKYKTNCELIDFEKSLQNFKKIKFTTPDCDLYIRHIYKYVKNNFSMFLDLEVDYSRNLNLSEVEQNLIKINQILFDAFHWGINSSMLKIMEGEYNE